MTFQSQSRNFSQPSRIYRGHKRRSYKVDMGKAILLSGGLSAVSSNYYPIPPADLYVFTWEDASASYRFLAASLRRRRLQQEREPPAALASGLMPRRTGKDCVAALIQNGGHEWTGLTMSP